MGLSLIFFGPTGRGSLFVKNAKVREKFRWANTTSISGSKHQLNFGLVIDPDFEVPKPRFCNYFKKVWKKCENTKKACFCQKSAFLLHARIYEEMTFFDEITKNCKRRAIFFEIFKNFQKFTIIFSAGHIFLKKA